MTNIMEKSTMTIEEVCRKSGCSRSTIHRYHRVGLLHEPAKDGKRLRYDESHLTRLEEIRSLAEEGKGTFMAEAKDLRETSSADRVYDEVSGKKEKIIEKAIEHFSRKGFAGTKIEDITNDLGMAKGTLYLYYKSKRDLLLDSIGRLFTIAISREVWEDIHKETDYPVRHRKRLIAFLKAFPTFRGILNLVTRNIESKDENLARRARDSYRMLCGPLTRDLRWLMAHGMIRRTNEEVIAFSLLGMGISLGFLIDMNPGYTPEKIADTVLEFVLHGLGFSAKEETKEESPSWEIVDREGVSIKVRRVLIDGKDYLPGLLGIGEMQVSLANVSSLSMTGKDSVVATAHEGASISLTIDGAMILSGDTGFGRYTIPLEQVTRISLAGGRAPSLETPSPKEGNA
jgi:AcrR family transcriptional regulator